MYLTVPNAANTLNHKMCTLVERILLMQHYIQHDLNDKKNHAIYQILMSRRESSVEGFPDENRGHTYQLPTEKLTPFDYAVTRRPADVLQ